MHTSIFYNCTMPVITLLWIENLDTIVMSRANKSVSEYIHWPMSLSINYHAWFMYPIRCHYRNVLSNHIPIWPLDRSLISWTDKHIRKYKRVLRSRGVPWESWLGHVFVWTQHVTLALSHNEQMVESHVSGGTVRGTQRLRRLATRELNLYL